MASSEVLPKIFTNNISITIDKARFKAFFYTVLALVFRVKKQ